MRVGEGGQIFMPVTVGVFGLGGGGGGWSLGWSSDRDLINNTTNICSN